METAALDTSEDVLSTSAERINDLHEQIASHRDEALASASAAIRLGIECGGLLSNVRSIVGVASLEEWLAHNCPALTSHRASRYIKVADRCKDLDIDQLEFNVVSEMYVACELLPEPNRSDRNSSAVIQWISWVGRIEKWLPKMPQTDRDELRKRLEVLLRRLSEV